jgi:hypothetical protein
MSRIRIVPMLVALVVVLSALFGGWEMYSRFGLAKPLKEQLGADQKIASVETIVNGPQREVRVALKKVDDLQSTYEHIEEVVLEAMGPRVVIDLQDTRDEKLKAEFRQIQPILYAGIAKGEFPAMIEGAKNALAKNGVQAEISMNDRYVFVKIEQGEHFLYEVLPYKTVTADENGTEVSSL